MSPTEVVIAVVLGFGMVLATWAAQKPEEQWPWPVVLLFRPVGTGTLLYWLTNGGWLRV